MTRKSYPADFPLPEGIAQHDIDRVANFRGSVINLNKQYGEGKWGAQEVVFYILTRRAEKVEEKYNPKAVVTKSSRTRDEKLENYLSVFKNVTPNDEQSLLAMVDIEIQQEIISRKLDDEGLTSSDRKSLNETYASLSREHRQLQTSLGIGRAERSADIDAAQEIGAFVTGAREFLEKQSIPIRCRHCNKDLNLGFVVFHHRNVAAWEFNFQCPKCGKTNRIQGKKAWKEEEEIEDETGARVPLLSGSDR